MDEAEHLPLASDERSSGARIHAYLRGPVTGKEHERVGPFVTRLTPGNGHPMLNYAIPDDDAQPTADEIEALVDAFRRRGLRPRLEYVTDAAPEVEARLVHAGFSVDARYPLLGCRPSEARAVEAPSDFVVARAETDQDHRVTPSSSPTKPSMRRGRRPPPR